VYDTLGVDDSLVVILGELDTDGLVVSE